MAHPRQFQIVPSNRGEEVQVQTSSGAPSRSGYKRNNVASPVWKQLKEKRAACGAFFGKSAASEPTRGACSARPTISLAGKQIAFRPGERPKPTPSCGRPC